MNSSLNFSNCSIYYLPHGTLLLYDVANQLIGTGNDTIKTPALYITNCSADYDDVYLYYSEYLLNLSGPLLTNYSIDSFRMGMIAILYAYSAIVVSSWMLLVTLFLSSHKKPNTIKAATLLYSISVTIILAQTTNLMRYDTLLDVQNVHRFQAEILNGLCYLVLLMVCQLVTWIAWLDILVYITPVHHQRKIIFGGVLIIVVNTLFVGLNYFYDRQDLIPETKNLAIEILTVISQLIIQLTFVICFIVYTVRKGDIAYNVHTLPLLIVTIIFMLTPSIFYILSRYALTLRTWTGLFFTFGQIISSALIWEWIYDIEVLTNEIELKGIVGREIGRVNSTHDDPGRKRYFLGKRRVERELTNDEDGFSYELNNISFYSSDDEYPMSNNSYISRSDTSYIEEQSHQPSQNIDIQPPPPVHQLPEDESVPLHDDYDDLNEGQSLIPVTLPPDFEPHPNFDIGDYWIDEKRHNENDV